MQGPRGTLPATPICGRKGDGLGIGLAVPLHAPCGGLGGHWLAVSTPEQVLMERVEEQVFTGSILQAHGALRPLEVNEHQQAHSTPGEGSPQGLQHLGYYVELTGGVDGPDEDPRLRRRHLPLPQEALDPPGEVFQGARRLGVVVPEAPSPAGPSEDLLRDPSRLASSREGQEVLKACVQAVDDPVRGGAHPVERVGELLQAQGLQSPCHTAEGAQGNELPSREEISWPRLVETEGGAPALLRLGSQPRFQPVALLEKIRRCNSHRRRRMAWRRHRRVLTDQRLHWPWQGNRQGDSAAAAATQG
mmetsp:Transcript_3232/g.7668  ORF Transcript_3232/g.7668 Transcript_3232/m.7668 type:complete len:304 (+) Transcript_3232:952-1863(+)